jgi:hypothetical protein
VADAEGEEEAALPEPAPSLLPALLPYLFLRYRAHELRAAPSFSVAAADRSGELSLDLSAWVDRLLERSLPLWDPGPYRDARYVEGIDEVGDEGPSSPSSSSGPPKLCELLLLARRARLSLRAAYLDLPLGYLLESSPVEYFLLPESASSSGDTAAVLLDLFRNRLVYPLPDPYREEAALSSSTDPRLRVRYLLPVEDAGGSSFAAYGCR